MTDAKYDYGRAPIRRGRPAAAPVDDGAASCAKCRHLSTAEPATCAKSHPFNPLACGSFSDASRERSFRPFFDYNLWLRR